MRQIFRAIGLRYGVGLGLIALVVAVIAVAKVLPHRDLGANSGVTISVTSSPIPSISSEPDDGLTSFAPPPPPSTSPRAATPTTVATDFAHTWLRHDGVTEAAWYQAITSYCTPDLAAQFDGVDPSDVPATRVVGTPTSTYFASTYVQISIPMDGGTLVLGLTGPNGVWLVQSVDWNRN